MTSTQPTSAVLPRSLAFARTRVSAFQIVFALLTVFYGFLGISYLTDPARAVRGFSHLNKVLGGGPLAAPDVPPWRYVAAIGMVTLGLMCLMLLVDLRRNYPVLLPAAFFKTFNAAMWFVYYGKTNFPVFLFAGCLDIVLVAAMVAVARYAFVRLERAS